MQTVAILPIKELGSAKQRLTEVLSPKERSELMAAMAKDVLQVLQHAQIVDQILIVSSDPVAAELAERYDAGLITDFGAHSHSEAATLGLNFATEQNYQVALLAAGDCPLLTAVEVDQAVGAALAVPNQAAIILNDAHGNGTNGLVLKPPRALEPSFGPDSHRIHRQLATDSDLSYQSLSLTGFAYDVDTPTDLKTVSEKLSELPATVAPNTRNLLEQFSDQH